MRAKYAQYGSVTISAAEAIPTVFSPHRPRGQALIDLISGNQTVLIGVSDLPHIHALPLPRTCHLRSRRRLARSATVRRTVFLLLLFFFFPFSIRCSFQNRFPRRFSSTSHHQRSFLLSYARADISTLTQTATHHSQRTRTHTALTLPRTCRRTAKWHSALDSLARLGSGCCRVDVIKRVWRARVWRLAAHCCHLFLL